MKRDRDNPFVGDFEPEHMMELLEGMSWHEFSRPDLSFVYRNLLRSFLSADELKLDFRKFMELMFEYFPDRMEENQTRLGLDGFKRAVIMEGFFEDRLPSVYPGHFVEENERLCLRYRGSLREEEIGYYFRLPHFLSELDIQECVDLVNFLQLCNTHMLLVISKDPSRIDPEEFVLASTLTVFILNRHWGAFHLAIKRDDDLDALFMCLLTPLYHLAEEKGEKWIFDLCLFFRLAVDAMVFGKVNVDQARAYVYLLEGIDSYDLGQELLDSALKLIRLEGALPFPKAELKRQSFTLDNFNQVVIAEKFIPPPYLYLDGIYLGNAGGMHFYFCTEVFTLRHMWSISEQIGLGSIKFIGKNGHPVKDPLKLLHVDTVDFLRANLNDLRIPFPDPFRTITVVLPSDLELSPERVPYEAYLELKGYRFYLIPMSSVYDIEGIHDVIRETHGAEIFLH